MIKHLIGFVGTAKAGKSTLSNYTHGCILSRLHDEEGKNAIEDWKLNDLGKLEIKVDTWNPDTKEFESQYNELDVDNRSADFQLWAKRDLWKFCKSFSLAHPLKKACMNMLGLTYQQVYGKDKYTETQYKWGDFAKLLDKSEQKRIKENNLSDVYMTSRQVMEWFGTKVMRTLDENIYAKRLVEQLKTEDSHIGLITDIRRLNEAQLLKENGCTLIRLTRGESVDISEVDINEIVPDFTIDNVGLTMLESCEKFNEILKELKVFDKP